jgi:hypothetical protein
VEIWIIGVLVAAAVLFVLYNKFVRRLKAGKDDARKDIYPLW